MALTQNLINQKATSLEKPQNSPQQQENNKAIKPLKKPTNKAVLEQFEKVRVPDAFDSLLKENNSSKASYQQAFLPANNQSVPSAVLNVANPVILNPPADIKNINPQNEEE